MENLKVAILGAGNGAHAFAGTLGMQGFPIRLYNVFEEEIQAIRERGGVEMEGVVTGFGPVEMVTTDPASAIPWADLVMVVVPAFVHGLMAEICAPHLREGQIIVLNPGRTGGALEFSSVLKREGVSARVYVAEAESLTFACRISGPARVLIPGIKRQVALAAFPGCDTHHVLEVASKVVPQFIPADSVLETSMDNIGAVFHPSTVVLNANRIEAGKDFDFYRGMTPTVTKFLQAIDDERLAVAQALGVKLHSAREWLIKSYEGVSGDNLYECIQSNHAYEGLKAPKSIHVRYILEDIPTGLVPFASLGEQLGVPTPASRAITDVCCVLVDRDFWEEGRTAEKLGLAGMDAGQIRRYVMTGQDGH